VPKYGTSLAKHNPWCGFMCYYQHTRPRLNQPQNSSARAPLLISHTYNKTDYIQSWFLNALPRPFISRSHSNTLWFFAYCDTRGCVAYMHRHPSLVAVASLPATVERDVETGKIRCKSFVTVMWPHASIPAQYTVILTAIQYGQEIRNFQRSFF
jgi:hypothetical protein